jgi:acetoin utilization protein AcuC
VCGGKWVVTGGGGYALVDVVPRAWSHLLAVVGGHPLDVATATPESWREHVRARLGRTAPYRLTDGRDPAYRDWAEGYDPAIWLDRSIMATREEIFPYHGLDPLP